MITGCPVMYGASSEARSEERGDLAGRRTADSPCFLRVSEKLDERPRQAF